MMTKRTLCIAWILMNAWMLLILLVAYTGPWYLGACIGAISVLCILVSVGILRKLSKRRPS